MAEDHLELSDIEAGILSGVMVSAERDDPRGTRYRVHGTSADGKTAVGTVGRFTGTCRYLIIIVYEVGDNE